MWVRSGRWAAGTAVAIGLFGVFLHYTRLSGDLLTSAVAFAPLLMAVALAGLLLALIVRAWWVVGIGAVVVLVSLLTQVPLYVNGSDSAAGEFTVLSINLDQGRADVAELAELVQRYDVDVLTATEVTPAAWSQLASSPIAAQLKYSVAHPADAGNGGAVLSRYPITEDRRLDEFWLPNIRVVVDLPGGKPLVVYGVHVMPPYPDTSDQWRAELRALSAALAAETGPVIVAGDFNATYDHRHYRQLMMTTDGKPGMTDAAEETGAGMVRTYPTDQWFPALLAIDHVLSRGGPQPVSFERFELPGTDHYGVLARFRGVPTRR
ncbi:endonuclease/exonuclease/phosphatase family protein [Gordonia phosphorivorans]|uniref:Endonuclease/exonuclease/phosphatase family protein n=1 Tax=Gordonia phosphorivorans TaxID=1056982 RepID=A0ABV6H966_9ACTN